MRDADFERLYADHAAGLYSFLAYRTGDSVLAEDLVADTFERVLRTKVRFDPRKGKEKTWIYSIAMNLLRDGARRNKVEARVMQEEAIYAAVTHSHSPHDLVDDRDQLRNAIAALAPEEQDAIALRFGGELSVPEIAKVTGEKLTTVEGRVYRALRKLRKDLE